MALKNVECELIISIQVTTVPLSLKYTGPGIISCTTDDPAVSCFIASNDSPLIIQFGMPSPAATMENWILVSPS